MIKIFNSAFPGSHRMLNIDEVTVREVKLNSYGEPRMIFAHKDYPLGDLYAEFKDGLWMCDMD
jgi:hypothetical protein